MQVLIQCAKNSGQSLFYDYKIQFCVDLPALVDVKYSFQYVQVWCKRRISDGGVFRNSNFYEVLMNDT
jgi:hypothetical protein